MLKIFSSLDLTFANPPPPPISLNPYFGAPCWISLPQKKKKSWVLPWEFAKKVRKENLPKGFEVNEQKLL